VATNAPREGAGDRTVRHQTLVASAAVAIAMGGACKKPPAPAPALEVYVAPVEQRDVPVYLDLVGQTAGFQDVDIRARVEGFLESVNFREGSFVRKGALLYTIDRKPFEAALAGANADQERAKASLAKNENDVARYTPLVAKQAVSQQDLDNARSARDAARAQLDAARAAVEEATLNLGYTRVFSPIDGLIGTTQVKPGNLVGRAAATVLTTVSQIDPMIFRVAITESDYLKIVRERPSRVGQAPVTGGIELTLSDGTVHPEKGRVGPVERAVDPTTGTLGVQLIFPNSRRLLRPGQYGRARILLETKRDALLVPQRAVQELQNLYSVAVVDAKGRVAFRNVTVGPRVDTQWVVERGLEPGDQVVAEGLQAIRDGAEVRTKPLPVATSGSGPNAPAHEVK
jgi:membrane fusion protein (multidrug efflux system)